eukprot:5212164-Pleurochrysis_carterae.AAC.2
MRACAHVRRTIAAPHAHCAHSSLLRAVTGRARNCECARAQRISSHARADLLHDDPTQPQKPSRKARFTRRGAHSVIRAWRLSVIREDARAHYGVAVLEHEANEDAAERAESRDERRQRRPATQQAERRRAVPADARARGRRLRDYGRAHTVKRAQRRAAERLMIVRQSSRLRFMGTMEKSSALLWELRDD